MKTLKRKVCILILAIIFYVLQTTLCKTIAIASISPNIMIIIPICFGYFKGKNEGIYAGFVTGLLYDLFFTSVFGFSILAYTYIGFISGIFQKEYNQNSMLIPMIITVVSTFSYDFLVYIGGFLLFNKLDLFYYLGRIIIPGTIYTLITMALAFKPMYYLSIFFEKKDRRKVTEYVSGN